MKFSSCLTTEQWHHSQYLIRDWKESPQEVEESIHSCPGLNPCLILLKHRLCFEEAKKNNCDVHCAWPSIPRRPQLCKPGLHIHISWLWQTLNLCVFLLLKNSLGYFSVSTSVLYSKCFFPRLTSHMCYSSANRVVVFKGNFHVTLNKQSDFKIFF